MKLYHLRYPIFLPPGFPRDEPPGGGERGETGAGREGTGGRGGSKGRRDAPDSSESGRGKAGERVLNRDGITVVSAFEGYAFDAGMRAGDRITAINGQPVAGISVDKARAMLHRLSSAIFNSLINFFEGMLACLCLPGWL